jgi:hypothetical protein
MARRELCAKAPSASTICAWAFLDGKDHADVIVCAAHLEEESMFEFLRGVRDSEAHQSAKFLILALAEGAADQEAATVRADAQAIRHRRGEASSAVSRFTWPAAPSAAFSP